jgi:hypothetical protein
MKRSIRGLQPSQAPYYPRAEELAPSHEPAPTPARSKPNFGQNHKR